MESQIQRISVGEQKFRAMVNDLMTMDKPSMLVATVSSSKARSLRRMFYSWRENLAEMEKNFMKSIEFKLMGRHICVERKADWTPVETEGVSNVPEGEGKPA